MNVEKYTNEHPRAGYLLHKCMATNTPKGVGADLSCPHHNQNQLVLECEMALKEYQKKRCYTTIRTLMFYKNNTLA